MKLYLIIFSGRPIELSELNLAVHVSIQPSFMIGTICRRKVYSARVYRILIFYDHLSENALPFVQLRMRRHYYQR